MSSRLKRSMKKISASLGQITSVAAVDESCVAGMIISQSVINGINYN